VVCEAAGIYEGAAGELHVTAPKLEEPGSLVVSTAQGDLLPRFMESGEGARLRTNLEVDPERSSGIYQHAEGRLEFALDVQTGGLGRGPYWGTPGARCASRARVFHNRVPESGGNDF
jgi:hypothetical protein